MDIRKSIRAQYLKLLDREPHLDDLDYYSAELKNHPSSLKFWCPLGSFFVFRGYFRTLQNRVFLCFSASPEMYFCVDCNFVFIAP